MITKFKLNWECGWKVNNLATSLVGFSFWKKKRNEWKLDWDMANEYFNDTNVSNK